MEASAEKVTALFTQLAEKYLAATNHHQSAANQFAGYRTVEHRFAAPLDFSGQYLHEFALTEAQKAQLPQEITVFAREYIADGGADRPRLIYFQGGPGYAGTRPAPMSGWMQKMLQHYRIVMLDERGTGQSHAMDAFRLATISDPKTQAAYLACFRADHIVADAELLRRLLQGDEKWTAFGQSFGGFCITSYLSLAPSGLKEAFITAGLPSTFRHADEVYRHTWAAMEARTAQYFRAFPADEATCWEIAAHLAEYPEFLPTGERLTPQRFRMLGMVFTGSTGFEKLHYLLEDPFIEIAPTPTANPAGAANLSPQRRRLSSRFLYAANEVLSFGAAPLYWALHESIYAQKQALCASGFGHDGSAATAWAAQRVRDSFPQFRVPQLSDGARGEHELRTWVQAHGFGFRFSCEHVFPWQGAEDPALRELAAAAEILANFSSFPALHEPQILSENQVPVKAWIYQPDMCVPFALSMETAKQIRGLQPFISETFHHDALHAHTDEILAAFLNS